MVTWFVLQLIAEEMEAKKKCEKRTKVDIETMWTSLKKSVDEEVKQMKDAYVVWHTAACYNAGFLSFRPFSSSFFILPCEAAQNKIQEKYTA